MRFRKPETVPLLFIIAAVAMLLSLGVWQVGRLQWKNVMIADIEKAQSLPALGTLPQDLSGVDYRNVALVGTFLYDKSLYMIGDSHGAQQPGYDVLTPLRLEDDGRIVLVDRGFSPKGKESNPPGIQTVKGLILPLRRKTVFFVADNRPDINLWFYEDIPAMSKATGLALTPVVVAMVGTSHPGVYPIPSDGKIALRNDHLQYAITWFSLAAIGVVMFGFYLKEPKV